MNALCAAVAVTALCAAGDVNAQPGMDRLKQNGCTACHALDRKVIGPAYNDVAAKYRGDAKAPSYLFKKVKQGGAGVWGPAMMPPNEQVSDADIEADVAFILGLAK